MISCSLQKKNNLLLNFVSYCDQKVNPENEKLRPEDTIQPKMQAENESSSTGKQLNSDTSNFRIE